MRTARSFATAKKAWCNSKANDASASVPTARTRDSGRPLLVGTATEAEYAAWSGPMAVEYSSALTAEWRLKRRRAAAFRRASVLDDDDAIDAAASLRALAGSC